MRLTGLASRPWLVVPVCIAGHTTFAIGTLMDPAVEKITPLYALHLLAGNAMWIVLLAVAALALVPMVTHVRSMYVHLFLWPQQMVLFLSMTSALTAAWNGVYPDGYKPSSGMFIYADQCFMVYIMFAHLTAVIRNARLNHS